MFGSRGTVGGATCSMGLHNAEAKNFLCLASGRPYWILGFPAPFFRPRHPLADPADPWPDPEVMACSREVDDNAFSIIITADVVRVEKMTGRRQAVAVQALLYF